MPGVGGRRKGETTAAVMARARARTDGERLPAVGARARERETATANVADVAENHPYMVQHASIHASIAEADSS